jgi:hypothetical protein
MTPPSFRSSGTASKFRSETTTVGGMADLKLGIKLTGVCDRANARCQSSPMFKVRHSYSVFSARRPASVIRTGATSLMAYSPPPALSERRHRGLARHCVAVRRCGVLVLSEGGVLSYGASSDAAVTFMMRGPRAIGTSYSGVNRPISWLAHS